MLSKNVYHRCERGCDTFHVTRFADKVGGGAVDHAEELRRSLVVVVQKD